MDLSEVNWDFNAAGSWPLQVKAGMILIVCCLVAVVGVYTFTMDQLNDLENLTKQEGELISTFEGKQKKAVNLDDYRRQLKQIEELLKGMMKQMPTKAEVANLLAEISQTAVNSGLEQRLFQPETEVKKEIYVELPYTIEMVGKYEELGLFVSGLASLPRIVTVHDIEITREGDASMRMKAIVKTYNEISNEQESDKQGTGK